MNKVKSDESFPTVESTLSKADYWVAYARERKPSNKDHTNAPARQALKMALEHVNQAEELGASGREINELRKVIHDLNKATFNTTVISRN
jgi:uncharacterized coiled-coil DUF342 family protein